IFLLDPANPVTHPAPFSLRPIYGRYLIRPPAAYCGTRRLTIRCACEMRLATDQCCLYQFNETRRRIFVGQETRLLTSRCVERIANGVVNSYGLIFINRPAIFCEVKPHVPGTLYLSKCVCDFLVRVEAGLRPLGAQLMNLVGCRLFQLFDSII